MYICQIPRNVLWWIFCPIQFLSNFLFQYKREDSFCVKIMKTSIVCGSHKIKMICIAKGLYLLIIHFWAQLVPLFLPEKIFCRYRQIKEDEGNWTFFQNYCIKSDTHRLPVYWQSVIHHIGLWCCCPGRNSKICTHTSIIHKDGVKTGWKFSIFTM